ncbi:hypothetical protein EOD40_08990 [Flavobacterium sufflavum]|uniref:Uncharacterized protein n=1 Tax=Flavobacterium sufflavum TaxID=1921138 RepID=A0A437KW50_9FLAO|nr:hypothetical protein [Flavobacterium sufflavum]RVT76628.1 hypothetical protein EOD40_08990 [Flavobacterium sufflavum]
MKDAINSNEDIEFIKKLYLKELSFDLENSKNKGHAFYDNYQILLKLQPKSEKYNYILYHSLFDSLEYLSTIKNSSQDEWKIWRRRLVNNKENVGIFGDIFELYMNWTLVQKKITYKKSERPDFSINYNNKEIYIECTSAQFNFDKVPTKNQILKKLKSVIRGKMIKEYMNSSTALFIDITNLNYHSKNINLTLENELIFQTLIELDEELKKKQINPNKSFGLICFLYFDYSIDDNNETHYTCNTLPHFKRQEADENLIDFMEKNLIPKFNKIISHNPKFNH